MHVRLAPGLLAALFALAACRDAKVTSYRVPKEKPDPLPPILTGGVPMPDAGGSDMAATAVPTASGDDLTWEAPAAWQPKPLSAMRKGSFTVSGDNGATADLSVTAFPGDVGGVLANVNRWRGQVQLPPVGDGDLASATTRLESHGLAFVVVDLANPPSESNRILGALVPYDGATWFFKLMGPDALVEQQKSAFLAFLHTVKPTAPARAMPDTGGGNMASTAVPTATGDDFTWEAPPAWQPQPLSPMRKGSFTVSDKNGAEADMSITAFPGDVGGVLANVNRWRGQVRLPPIDEAGLSSVITRIESRGLTFIVVDFADTQPDSKRILGALMPAGGATWFFKFMGPDTLVEQQKSAFLAFLQTVKPAVPRRATR